MRAILNISELIRSFGVKVRLATLVFAGLVAVGCRSTVMKSGDAKIVHGSQFPFHSSRDNYWLEFPSVSLARSNTQVMRVRDLPPSLKGVFNYSLAMNVPGDEGPFGEKDAPWRETKINIAFHSTNGVDLGTQDFVLGASGHGWSQGHDGWELGWTINAGRKYPLPNESYDIVVTVERPSARSSDRISLTAYASVDRQTNSN